MKLIRITLKDKLIQKLSGHYLTEYIPMELILLRDRTNERRDPLILEFMELKLASNFEYWDEQEVLEDLINMSESALECFNDFIMER